VFVPVLRDDNGRSPAVTIDVHLRGSRVLFSIDIVAAVRLLDWPKTARGWTSGWLPSDVTHKITNPIDHDYLQPCVVPKIHSTGAYVSLHAWTSDILVTNAKMIWH